ncbi:MAG: hypothetical protein E7496_07210 [Ruminococcus sp.]|nr:hypothetical protein [Ruminococcus sp.]
MSREKELVKNTIILSIGRFIPQLISFITIPILTAKLTKTEYGYYDLIATLVMLVIPIATLQIQSAAFRFLIDCRGDKERSAGIISTIWTVTIPITLLVSFFMPLFFRNVSAAVKILIAVYFLIDTIYLTAGQIVRGLGHNREYAIASVCLSVVNMAGLVLSVQVAEKGLLGVIASMAAANFAASLYLFLSGKLYQFVKKHYFSADLLKEMLAFSWPMIPNNLSTWVLKLSDRLVITFFLGVEANAVYAVANKIPNVLSVAQAIMVMAWQENASMAVNDKNAEQYYTKMLKTYYNFIFGFTAVLIAGMPVLFKILIKGDYDEAYYQIPLLVLGTFFYVMSSYFGGIYIAHKKTVNVGISTMIAAAINLILDLCLVNFIGITAGSLSTLISYALLYYYRMYNVQKFQKIGCNLKLQFLQLGILVLMTAFCFTRQLPFYLANILLGGFSFFFFNQEIITVLLKKMTSLTKKKA